LERIIQWLQKPDGRFGPNPDQGRDEFLRSTFAQSLQRLKSKLGADMDNWQYGQEKYKHVFLQHPFSKALGDNIKTKLDMGPLPRGGNNYTVGTTGDSDRQARGASFRMIVNTGDWDKALGTNTPGQSGDPNSWFYSNLFEPWAKDEYFPLYYSREKIESVAAERVVIRPGGQ
jgi:penicillin G amidase